MAADAALLEAPPESPVALPHDVGAAGPVAPQVAAVPLSPASASALVAQPRTRGTPCSRFAWVAAGTGVALFVAGLVEAVGTWAVSSGAVSLTVASVAGVIAMEGCDDRAPRPRTGPRDPRR